MANYSATPAQQLSGRRLTNGWIVEDLVERQPTDTGGHFSTSYHVRSATGDKAFLKAMDYQKALQSPDPAKELERMTAAYNFERQILEKCNTNSLNRIVRVLDSGTLKARRDDPSSVVQYIVFELARGDIRSFVTFEESLDNAWVLRTLHQATAAVRQLHYAQIAHQDLKPSNVLLFDDDQTKLADLGRAFDRNSASPYDGLPFAGDRTYAPPELLYGYTHPDWRIRRLACDMYMLGSLVVYFYTGVSLTHLIFMRIDEAHDCNTWSGTYEEVLPYLQEVFAGIVVELQHFVPHEYASEVMETVRQLCNPDPVRRGHPKNLAFNGDRYSLERYVSLFDRLAARAEWSTRQLLNTFR